MRTALAVAALTFLAACTPPGRSGPPTVDITAAPADDYYGWSARPDATPRLLNAASVAAVQWGGDERELEGLAIHVAGKVYPWCGTTFACTLLASNGSNDMYLPTTLLNGADTYCAELTPLAHEIGHIVLGGDRQHADPRWCDRAFWSEMAEALRPGIPAADAQCLQYLSDFLWVEIEGFCR